MCDAERCIIVRLLVGNNSLWLLDDDDDAADAVVDPCGINAD